MNLVELQRTLDRLIEQKWRASETFRQDLLGFKELFSAFKLEYDSQLHVPRFSICMSNEDYDRMVHVSRKHLEDKVVEYKNVIEMGKAEGIDFAFLKGALSVWEELLEGSEHHFLTVSEAREKLKEVSKEAKS